MEGKHPLPGSLEVGGVRLPGERGRAVAWVDGWDITGISDFRMLTEDRVCHIHCATRKRLPITEDWVLWKAGGRPF